MDVATAAWIVPSVSTMNACSVGGRHESDGLLTIEEQHGELPNEPRAEGAADRFGESGGFPRVPQPFSADRESLCFSGALPAGVEPATSRLGSDCSIQLSYGSSVGGYSRGSAEDDQ